MISNGTIIENIGCEDCSLYDVVSYNSVENKYVPAQPRWVLKNDIIGPAPESYIVGMICSTPDASGKAQILINGVIDFGTERYATSGEYYLDADGKMSLGPKSGVLPVYCGYRLSEGKFVFNPAAPVYGGHRHTVYTLSGGTWSGSGTTYTYDDTNDPTCQQLLASIPINTIIAVYDGNITPLTEANKNASGQLEITASGTPSSVTLYGTDPLATIEPDVRAVAPAAGNNIIKATKVYGTVYLDTDFAGATTDGAHTGQCISSLTKAGVSRVSVINRLTPLGNLQMVQDSTYPGNWTISDKPIGTLIDFQTINANNVLIGNALTDAFITFPSGISSSVTGTLRLPPASADAVWNFKLFLWVTGTCNLNYGLRIQNPPLSRSSSEENILETATYPTDTVISGGTENEDSELLSTTTYSANGDALVSINLFSNGTEAKLRAFGIMLVAPTTTE